MRMNWLACWRDMLRTMGKLKPGNHLVIAGRRTGKTSHAIAWLVEQAVQGEVGIYEYWGWDPHLWTQVVLPQLRKMSRDGGWPVKIEGGRVWVGRSEIVYKVYPRIRGKAAVIDEIFMALGGGQKLVVGTPTGTWERHHLPTWKAATVDLKELQTMREEMHPDRYRQEFEAEW